MALSHKTFLEIVILFVTCKNQTNEYLNELPTNGSSILVTIGATKIVPLKNEIENRLIVRSHIIIMRS